MPKVSVIMPIFNRQLYAREAIDSILSQSCSDFELIIVDDGSTDKTVSILQSYDDPRIKTVLLPQNCSISIARNIGMRMADGEYLAVMDSDDISMPERLTSQVRFLDEHSEIQILGTSIRKLMPDGPKDQDHPPEDSIIKAYLLSMDGTAMIHSSTMMRHEFLVKNDIYYAPRATDEDHGLWIDAMAAGAKFHNLPDRLFHYRRHDGNMTGRNSPLRQTLHAHKTPLRAKLLGLLFPDLTQLESHALARLMEFAATLDIGEVGLGIASAEKVQRYGRNAFGASQAHIHSIVNRHKMNAVNSLNSVLK